MESSLITNALVQAQLYLTDFLLQILHATVDLLQLYVDENFLFSNVVMLHISIMRLLQLGHLQHKWDSSLKEDKKMVCVLKYKVYDAMCLKGIRGDIYEVDFCCRAQKVVQI